MPLNPFAGALPGGLLGLQSNLSQPSQGPGHPGPKAQPRCWARGPGLHRLHLWLHWPAQGGGGDPHWAERPAEVRCWGALGTLWVRWAHWGAAAAGAAAALPASIFSLAAASLGCRSSRLPCPHCLTGAGKGPLPAHSLPHCPPPLRRHNVECHYQEGAEAVGVLSLSVSFDAHVQQLFPPLLAGGCLVLPKPQVTRG